MKYRVKVEVMTPVWSYLEVEAKSAREAEEMAQRRVLRSIGAEELSFEDPYGNPVKVIPAPIKAVKVVGIAPLREEAFDD